MKSKLLVALLMMPFCASANIAQSDAGLQKLLNHKETRTVKLTATESERLKIIKEKAYSLGHQSGAYHAGKIIRERLERMSPTLDSLYDFGRLGILQSYKGVYIINPIVHEIEKSISLSPDSRSFIVRDQIFIIAKDPYLSLTIPSWRSYTELQVEPVYVPEDLIAPKTKEEVEAWKSSMLAGYKLGIAQVEDTVVKRLQRLTSDIIGMLRYKLLRQRNLISNIKISDVYYPVSGGGNRMNINETRASIEVNPALNTNRWDWKTIPRLADISEMFPNDNDFQKWISVGDGKR
jgi:defect in organelle trafficking protein DotC